MTIHDLDARTPLGFRTKPHNIDAEQALLGAILVNNQSYHRVGDFLRADQFYEPAHGRIYASMERLITAGRVADPVTMRLQFDQDPDLAELDGAQYLARIQRSAEALTNAEDYGRHLHDLAMKRSLIGVSEDTANLAYDAQDETPAIAQLERAQHALDEIALNLPDESWRSVEQIAAELIESLGQPEDAYSTGLHVLDNSMVGGIRRGAVYGFEARPKSFKTGTLGTIALSLMRQSVPFLFLALEMGSHRIVERQIASETRCNTVRFRQRQDREDLMSKVRVFGDRYAARRAYFADEPGLSFDRLRRLAHTAVVKLGIRVLFVDYWQLITGCPKGQTKADFTTETAQWLAAFAGRHNVAVVVASQENRTGESFGGDGIAKACDWLGVLHKVDHHDTFAGDFEAVWMDVKFNRDGSDGALGCADDPAFRIDKIGPVLRDIGDWN